MPKKIYEALQSQLDQYSAGFPKTASGVEFRILEKLFTEDEAVAYLDLSLMLETSDSFAERTGRDPETAAEILENMSRKGLVFRQMKNNRARYAAAAFVIGSYEYQVGRMDRDMAEMFEAYFKEAMLQNVAGGIVPLRTIPVRRSVDVKHPVAPYEDARRIVRSKDTIALADCICRKQQQLIGHSCDKPMEACLIFGSHADYYVENGMAKYISHEDAIGVLNACEEAGMVNQPANTINPGGMCNCCGDCCNVLRALKLMPKPSEMVFNNYIAEADPEKCTACETCVERCQMDAVSVDGDAAVVHMDMCIGCGLCVTTCPSDAIQLGLKPESLHVTPPDTGMELMKMTAEKRGKSLTPQSMVT